MDLINKLLLDFVFPMLTVTLLLFLWPAELLFKFFNYLLRSAFHEKLAGKVVLITGASSGIGEYLAYEYAKRGARLALVARREELLDVVAGKAREIGSPDVVVISADVSKLDDCKRFIDETINHFGTLDHLVNNAGICWVQDQDQRCVSDYVSIMDINFWGSIYTTQFAVPHLRKTKGKITVVASAAGWFPSPRLSIYGASKAALISFFETLRIEVGSDIGITIVAPGLIESPITNDEWLSQTNLEWMPLASVQGCAKTIVDGASRGDEYLTLPAYVRVFFLLKLLCPRILQWIVRVLIVFRSKDPLLNGKPRSSSSSSSCSDSAKLE
ncbi:11-beta-hydroxysteroid dehydrogenase-like 4A [Cynara cardunculus var. scolymus]|uniref:11-beta-hydroxysteroid dehydrogenase-like 4A n=1 Tax=Cynara cardunculus var. scolymus TaxID=59895 RepID=UPI000D624166|nr:11-beta-hydroxysteroid dehydrogenase-like 4A [Cynara cardunculus var. scolymus]